MRISIPSQTKKSSHGFSLIELMTTVAILAVVAVVAIPSFRGQVMKSHRADAKITLADAAQRLERCFTEANTYVYSAGDANTHGCTRTADLAVEPFASEYYTFAVTQAATTFEVKATAKGGQLDDKDCKEFTIDHTGHKKAKNSGGTASTKCWK